METNSPHDTDITTPIVIASARASTSEMASNSRWSSFGGGRQRAGAGAGGGGRRRGDPFAQAREAHEAALKAEAARVACEAAKVQAQVAFEAAKVQALKDWEATGIIKTERGIVLPEYLHIVKRLHDEEFERGRAEREAIWAEEARKRAEYEATVIAEYEAEEAERARK